MLGLSAFPWGYTFLFILPVRLWRTVTVMHIGGLHGQGRQYAITETSNSKALL